MFDKRDVRFVFLMTVLCLLAGLLLAVAVSIGHGAPLAERLQQDPFAAELTPFPPYAVIEINQDLAQKRLEFLKGRLWWGDEQASEVMRAVNDQEHRDRAWTTLWFVADPGLHFHTRERHLKSLKAILGDDYFAARMPDPVDYNSYSRMY